MNQIDKLKFLIGLNQKLLHTQDLAVLWGMANRQTLYTNIKRLVKKKVLHPVQKGLYSLSPPSELNPFALGAGLMHAFGYLSCETVLEKAGVISAKIQQIIFVTDFSKKAHVLNHDFIFRKLGYRFLHQTAGIIEKEGYLEASPERAAADMLYFNPRYHFDNPQLLDFIAVQKIRKEVGYPC